MQRKMGFWSVVSVGVGGMVGGGIFAVLGLSVQVTQGGAPIAFAIAGVIALLTVYSYAQLSVAFPNRGGTVMFLNQAFGTGLFTGGMNILLWLSYIVMLSLYASAFGSYGATFFPALPQVWVKHGLLSGVILLITVLNLLSSDLIGRVESWIVAFKVLILSAFVMFGLRGITIQHLQPETWAPPISLVAGGMLIFLAYEGFELIANTAEDVRAPSRMLPRAYYTAVGSVVILYVLIAAIAVGTLSLQDIQAAHEYALAAAARPFLGEFGFTLIAIAALLSTASAINATLYGTSRLSYVIAQSGELPAALEKKVWNQPIEGLLITSALTLLVANLIDLSGISTMGSVGFLLIFAAVNGANVKLSKRTQSYRSVSMVGAIASIAAVVVLLSQTAHVEPQRIWIVIFLILSAFFIEFFYRKFKGRHIHLHPPNLK